MSEKMKPCWRCYRERHMTGYSACPDHAGMSCAAVRCPCGEAAEEHPEPDWREAGYIMHQTEAFEATANGPIPFPTLIEKPTPHRWVDAPGQSRCGCWWCSNVAKMEKETK